MKDFFKALQDYIRGHKLMVSEKWIKWLLLPGFIALLTFPITLTVAFTFLTPEAWLPVWMHGYLGTSLQFLSSFILAIIGYWAFQPLIMILLSPLFGHLAEQIEEKLYGISPPPFKWHLLIYDLLRGIVMAIAIAIAMFSFIAFFWMLSFIPLIGFMFAMIFIPATQMFFAGMGFADPALERRRLTLAQRWKFCWKNRMRILGLGAGFLALSMIPVLGWFLAPGYALIASSVSITEIFHKKDQA